VDDMARTYDPAKYAANPEKFAAYGKKYREKHKEKERLRHKIYKQNNKDKHAEGERRRRARKRNSGFEYYSLEQVLEKYGIICYLCNKEIDLKASRRVGRLGWEKGLHIDHVIQISKGGPDTLENVRPTHGLCNLERNSIYMVQLG
jgi:5-methylcytosine-specific restriction endonuclease McrA